MRIHPKVTYCILAAAFCIPVAFSGAETIEATEIIETTENQISGSIYSQIYTLPELSIDAERATYRSIISRPQDEIDAEKIDMLPTYNPVEIIRSQNSSINLGGGLGGSVPSPALRGLESKYTNVTLDGSPINTPWNWSSPLSGFPISRLNKVTVSNTGSSMIHGQNSIAGSVNFVLPTARDLEGLTFLQEIGGDGFRHQEYIFGHVGENSEHLFALFNDEYDGKRKFKNGFSFSDRTDNETFLYKGEFDLSHNLKFKSTLLKSDGSISLADAWSVWGKPSVAHYGGLRFEPWRMSLYSHSLEKEFNNKSNLIFRYSKYNDFSANVEYSDREMTTGRTVKDGSSIDMKTIDAIYNFKADNRNFISVGVQNQKIKDSHDSISKDFYGKEFENTSFFIADSIKASDKLNLHLTARSDESYEGEKDTSYGINSSYQITANTSVGFGLSRTVMLPTIQDLYAGGKGGRYGTPNLESEKSDNYEIRIGHELNDNWSFNITGYKYDIEDKIVVKTVDAAMVGQDRWLTDSKGNLGKWGNKDAIRANAEEAEISGIEFALNGQINDKFETWLSYTSFDKSEFTESGKTYKLTNVPDYRTVAGLLYRYNKTTAMLSVSHQGEMDTTSDPQNDIYPKASASTIVDLSVREQITDEFALYVKVYNLGNVTDAVLRQNYIANSSLVPDQYVVENGRRINIGAELRY